MQAAAAQAPLKIDPNAFGMRAIVMFAFASAGRWKDVDEQHRQAIRDNSNSPNFVEAFSRVIVGDLDAALLATERGVRVEHDRAGRQHRHLARCEKEAGAARVLQTAFGAIGGSIRRRQWTFPCPRPQYRLAQGAAAAVRSAVRRVPTTGMASSTRPNSTAAWTSMS